MYIFIRIFRLISGMAMLLTLPIYLLVGLIERNKNIWLFSAWQGNNFRGKARYFFEYVSGLNQDKVKVVWVTNNDALFKIIKSKGYMVVKFYSPLGIYYQLVSGYYFVSHGIVDVVPFLSKGAKIVKLGHSSYQLKNGGINASMSKMSLAKKIYVSLAMPYSYFIKNTVHYEVSSSVEAGLRSGTIEFNPDITILPLGSTKASYLSSLKLNKYLLIKKLFGNSVISFKKIIVFFPTWRSEDKFSIFSSGFNLSRLETKLKENDSILIVSFHPYDFKKRIAVIPKSTRILLLGSGCDDIDNILSVADLFITDYSSLFSDFLIFDKPIIFAQFCHREYIKNNLDIDSLPEELPGPVVLNWRDLENYLFQKSSLGLKDGIKRELWRRHIYGDNIGCASHDIYNYFLSLDLEN